MKTAEIRSLIKDQVSPVVAARMLDAEEQARDSGRKAELEGLDAAAQMRALAAKGSGYKGAIGDRARGLVFKDPHNGKGLDVARFVKASVMGVVEHKAPADVARSWAAKNPGYEPIARALSEGAFSGAGAVIPPEFGGDFIEMLYAATIMAQWGARPLEFNGVMDLGKQNSSATAYWVGEGANITPSQPGVGTMGLKRKKLAALVAMSNELLRNPSVSADMFVRDDLLRVMALKRDLAALRGTGTEHQPKGVKNWMATANANAMTGSPTLATVVADLLKLIRLVDESDIPMVSPGFGLSPRVLWYLAGLLDGNGNHVFLSMLLTGNLYGFPVHKTTQIPNNLGGGTESEVYFGDGNDLIAGEDTGTPLSVETFRDGAFYDGSAVVSGISTDQSVVRAIEGCDYVLRHNKSFAMITGVTWGA